MKQPMQPVMKDDDGKIRFQHNAVVLWMKNALRTRGIGMNEILELPFPREDIEQFYQLIGYTLSGYKELSFISSKSVAKAEKEAKKLI